MKQDDKGQKVGAKKILARKKASKDRAQAAALDFVTPKTDTAYHGSTQVEETAFGLNNDPNFKKFDKYVRDANSKANKGMVSQTVKGYTPNESTMVEDDGSESTMISRDIKTYEADNKAISATRGREIKAAAKENMINYGGGPIEATQRAIRNINREGNDSIVTPGKIARKGVDQAYKEALQATYKHYVPTKEAKAERARLKKSRQRTGGGGSAASRIGDNG